MSENRCLWTAQEAEGATGGRAVGDWAAHGVSIDTRSLQKGDLFVALKDQRDGHDYVAQALEQGAAAALVSRIPFGLRGDAPLLVVDDVLGALEALGRAGRVRSRAKVAAITGSAGKTSTKEMLRLMLERQGKTHAAEASYNNHWGVPLTLARLPQDADFAVIEIGMSGPGEIAPLARLAAPDAVMITTIAPAHLQAFEGIDGIAHEKAAIFEGLRTGGVAVLNADLESSPLLIERAHKAGARIVTFGARSGCDYHLQQPPILSEAATVIKAECAGTPLVFKIAALGAHFALGALGALALLDALGGDIVIGAQDLAAWQPPEGRGGRVRITLDPVEERCIDLIDDAFNANPASMAASLTMLATLTPPHPAGGKRVVILGDMLELGAQEAELHRALAEHPALRDISVIHCVGPRMRTLYEALPPRLRGEWTGDAQEMARRARHLFAAGDTVLVKGSKGSQVSLIARALRRMEQGIDSKGGI